MDYTVTLTDTQVKCMEYITTDALDWNDSDVRVITNDATTFTAEYTGNSPKALLRIGINLSE